MGEVKLGKQEVLQAVVLGSDFTSNLTPMQDFYPTILTPVANAHLFDYLIETLIRYGVQEVFIYCSDHIDDIKKYISSKNTEDIITISLIISDGCQSIGDALRDIDTKGWIRGDFILIRGDAFINANLTKLMANHRGRRERDKGAAMTLIFRDIGSTKKSILDKDTCLLVANKQTKKMLFYKKLKTNEPRIEFELEWFLNHDQVEINSGFIDTHVYICSPSVLPLFSDNFDFQTMEDFIRGVLMNEEILDSRIYWQQLKADEYAMPITSWPAYHILTRDILQRQGYPLTPEMLCPKRSIIYSLRSTYKHRSAVLERGCVLKRNTIVGEKCFLGKNVTIADSVIGKNCTIGENVTIENSHIFNCVIIDNNCVVKDSVIFPNCHLNESANVDACIVSSDIKLPPMSNYVNVILHNGNDGNIVKNTMTKYSTDDSTEFVYFKKQFHSEDDESYDTDDSRSDRSSITADSPIPDDNDRFLSEVIDSLLRGYQEKLICDNLILEINSSRYAYNVGIRDVTYNVVKGILLLPLTYFEEQNEPITDTGYQKVLKVMISYFEPILQNYIKTENAQEDCLRAFEAVANITESFLGIAQYLLHLLYEKDILSEEKILQWYDRENNNENNDDDNNDDDDDDDEVLYNKEIRVAIQPFIKWLSEAEEDSSSDDD
ncbi:hypothetical protein PV327_006523 [Microctonus hyperodae]|uniref:Translation initiation factor eIF2B subunit epsilon n=1 Tax=Microctonus hyperodae TaxID=165561 RepID=A0AA39KII7_MICHY|nr:hypothetical protein PV327_006523 [Microctonus hyperodae]